MSILLQLLLTLGGSILTTATTAKWPAEVIAALSAAVSSIAAAHALAVTKEQLEAQRG